MVGFLIIVGLLAFFQLVDYKEKKAKGEDLRGVRINFALLLVLTIAYFTDNLKH